MNRPVWVAGFALLIIVAFVYANSLRAPFLFDDAGAVTNNPTIRQLASLEVLRPPADGSTITGRPVVNLSYAINYAISGHDVWSYHALNLVIHAAAALLLFGIVRRTLQNREKVIASVAGFSPPSGDGARGGLAQRGKVIATVSTVTGAFFVAVIWAVHPLQSETVVCTAQRTESLCALWYLLTLYAFVRATSDGNRHWLVVSFGASALGMASKEVMVTAPVIVLLYDQTFGAGSFGAALRQRAGYYAGLALTWGVLLRLLWHGAGTRGASAGFGLGISAWQYLLTQASAIVRYLGLSFWPHPLVLDYGTGVAGSVADVWWQGMIVLLLLALTIWALVRRRAIGFLGAAFFLLLAPSSSFVPLVTQTIAEHRMYLPLAALVCAFVCAVARAGRGGILLLTVAAAGCAGLTLVRSGEYRDPLAIWTDNVASYPSAARPHGNLALLLAERGNPAGADTEFARAIALDPRYVMAHYDWGVALLEQGRLFDAIRELQAAIALAPDHVDARINLGNALVRAGRASDAVLQYEAAVRARPAADIRYNLGVAYLTLRRDEEAAQEFRAALALDAHLADAHYQLGVIAQQQGDIGRAAAEWNQASIAGSIAAHRKLGLMAAQAGDLGAAVDHFRAVITRAPNDADAYANLGNVFLLQGNAAAAITNYEQALRLRPNDPRLQQSLEAARAAAH